MKEALTSIITQKVERHYSRSPAQWVARQLSSSA